MVGASGLAEFMVAVEGWRAATGRADAQPAMTADAARALRAALWPEG